MVSPISIPGFPSVHTRQSAATCDAALESHLASLEACVAALPSLITAAIDQAFADSLIQFRCDMFFRGAGESISTPLTSDHHGSPAIDPIQLTRSPICAEGAQSQLSPLAIQAPPLLSSSPLLQALATSAVKPHSKDSAAATVLLPESKTGIHASTMTSAPRLLHKHSFSDTTKTGSKVLLLFGVIACYTGHSAFIYHAFLNAKYGWVNWYFVGKFVKKDFYALELFEEMSKRLNTYNMSLSSNLDAWDIVEDVAIAYEYNNITMRNQIPKSEPASLNPLALNEFTELIRLDIAMNGFTEVLTFILGSWQEIFPMSSYKDDKDVAKLKEIGESFIIEGNPESGSSITVVGSSHYAHEEYVSQLAKLRWGDGTVMVSQFMDELLTHGGRPCDNLGRELFWEKQPHMMQSGEDYAERMLSKFLDLTIRGNFEFQTATLLQMLKPLWNIVWIRDESTPIDYIQVASSDKFLSWVDHHFPDIYSCGSIFQITILPPTLGPFLSRLDHSLKGFIWRTLVVELFVSKLQGSSATFHQNATSIPPIAFAIPWKPTLNSKYKWNELSQFQNVEFYHVAKAIENVGVKWIALPPASILFLLIHRMFFMEVVRLAEMKQYCVNDANLSDALPPNQRKSLIAQTFNFLEVTSWDANNYNNSGKHCDGEDSAASFHFNTMYTGDISPSEYADMVKTTSHKSPSNVPKLVEILFEKGYDIVSGGTENHLVWVNLRDIGIDGSGAEKVLESVHIAAIKNNVLGYVFAVVLVGVLSIESPFSFETIIGVEGLEIDKGYFFPQIATNPEKLFVEFENAGVLITDPKISRMFKVGEDCQATGILVMVITGDNQNIAEAICHEIGVFGADEDIHSGSLTGKESISTIRAPKAHLRQGDGLLFSRVEPKHKQKIVRLLKEDGEVVAMTVDGVNDAPTLKLADIGIAMDISGTEGECCCVQTSFHSFFFKP